MDRYRCYIAPDTQYNVVNHPGIRTMRTRVAQSDIREEIQRNPPVCLFRQSDRELVEMLKKRDLPVCVDETARFEPRKGDWVFVVSYRQGMEREGRLVPPSVAFQSYIVMEVPVVGRQS